MRIAAVILLAIIYCGPRAFAVADAPTTLPTGRSQVAWPMPSADEFAKQFTALGIRYGFKISPDDPKKIRTKSQALTPDGKFVDPKYELYVPADDSPDTPFGLIVWISAGESGKPPREDWLKILDEHHLVWIGADHIGNDVDALFRTYMSLETVRQAKLHFAIDKDRIYVAGVSGGGRVASRSALVAADTFTGGMYFVGCDFFRDTPAAPPEKGRYFRGFWPKPNPKLIAQSKTHRFVLVTGENDMNRANTQSVYAGYTQAGYKHVTLFDIPGMGHTVPDMEWFEKGIEFLDKSGKGTSRPGPVETKVVRPSH